MFLSLISSKNYSSTYLIINEFANPQLNINQEIKENFQFLDIQFDNIKLNNFEKEDHLKENFFNMDKIKELGLLYNVNYVLINKVNEMDGRINLEGYLYNVESGGLIDFKKIDLIKYKNGGINELNIWIGELTGGIKNKWIDNRNSILFPNPNEITYKKTPMKSALRSFLVPGWGQFYSKKKLYAFLWFGAELSFTIVSYLSFRNYQQSRNNYLFNLNLYNNSNDEREVANYRSLAEENWDNHKISSEMTVFFAKVVGVGWMTNIIHAWIVGPRPHYEIYKK